MGGGAGGPPGGGGPPGAPPGSMDMEAMLAQMGGMGGGAVHLVTFYTGPPIHTTQHVFALNLRLD